MAVSVPKQKPLKAMMQARETTRLHRSCQCLVRSAIRAAGTEPAHWDAPVDPAA